MIAASAAPHGRHSDPAPTTTSCRQYAGPGVAVLNGAFKAGTLHEYTVYVVDYFGNPTEESSGVFNTLDRHVTVEFGTIGIFHDSDAGAGDFNFYFTVGDDNWDVNYPTNADEVEWDSGTVTSFGVVLDATGVGTSIPTVEYF